LVCRMARGMFMRNNISVSQELLISNHLYFVKSTDSKNNIVQPQVERSVFITSNECSVCMGCVQL
jgi:hypothetical protein